tara:strand:- start:879 stop:1043 length:165 start_codon:yes stop_codon:yes gene_type:complete
MITVPKTVFTYNGNVLTFSDDLIHIREAFKNTFDYESVMLPVLEPDERQCEWEF